MMRSRRGVTSNSNCPAKRLAIKSILYDITYKYISSKVKMFIGFKILGTCVHSIAAKISYYLNLVHGCYQIIYNNLLTSITVALYTCCVEHDPKHQYF